MKGAGARGMKSWLLDACGWLLVAGCWLLVAQCQPFTERGGELAREVVSFFEKLHDLFFFHHVEKSIERGALLKLDESRRPRVLGRNDETKAGLVEAFGKLILLLRDGFLLAFGHEAEAVRINADEDIARGHFFIAHLRRLLRLRTEKFHRERHALIAIHHLNRGLAIVFEVEIGGGEEDFERLHSCHCYLQLV